MPKSLRVLVALLFVTAQLLIPVARAREAVSSSGPTPQIVAFDNEDFLGDRIHTFGNMKGLGKWGNSVSSMVILSGTWEFFHDENFTGTSMGTLGPRSYTDVMKHGLKNTSVSSVRPAKPGASATP